MTRNDLKKKESQKSADQSITIRYISNYTCIDTGSLNDIELQKRERRGYKICNKEIPRISKRQRLYKIKNSSHRRKQSKGKYES